MFVGRKKELRRLEEFYNGPGKVMAVTGRAGVGKTTLLRSFSEDKNSVFFTAYPTTGAQELSVLAEALGIDRYEGLSDLLDVLTTRAKTGKKPLLFIVDHYPYFAKADAAFPKLLHHYVTEVWENLPVRLILCGDLFLSMKKTVTDKKAIWYPLLADQMELMGLDFFESREFFPDATPADAAFYYGITGGIPYHLTQIGGGRKETIGRMFLQPEDAATLMPEKTLSLELRELSYYNRILSALATGINRVNQISEAVEKPKDIVVPYMNTLIELGTVQKENPVTEPTNRRKTRYSIVNTRDIFWYRYIVPHIGLYYSGRTEELWKKYIAPNIGDFMKPVFTRMCREYLLRTSEDKTLPFQIHAIGNWWENDDEKKTTEGFDLVALGQTREGREMTAYACCYSSDRPVTLVRIRELIRLTGHVRGKNEEDRYIAFAHGGFNETAQTAASAVKNIMLVSLEDICR